MLLQATFGIPAVQPETEDETVNTQHASSTKEESQDAQVQSYIHIKLYVLFVSLTFFLLSKMSFLDILLFVFLNSFLKELSEQAEDENVLSPKERAEQLLEKSRSLKAEKDKQVLHKNIAM